MLVAPVLAPAQLVGYTRCMAATSQMLPLGTPIPAFALDDAVSGRNVSSAELAGRAVVVAFICNHCPYVQHLRSELARFGRDYDKRGVAVVGISSNDPASHPQDGPGPMAEEARQHGYVFPYLFDESQEVAKAFRAACTPEFYLFDPAGKLVYRGQFDDSRPGNGKPVTGADLRRAVDAVLKGEQPSPDQVPSIGCSIKWKKGNAPGY
jgi:peroxiredoxin